MTTDPALDVYAHARAVLATHADPVAQSFAETLPKAHEMTARALPATSPPDALDALGPGAPDTNLLVAHVRQAAPRLAWRQPYGPEDWPQDVLEATRWAPLADADGPLILDGALVELMSLAPNGRYPRHSHAPEELYLVLAGAVFWSADGHAPAWRRAGETIHHPPHRPHALETGAEAALLLTCWRGGGFERPDTAPSPPLALPPKDDADV